MKVLRYRLAVLILILFTFIIWFSLYVLPFKENVCDKMIEEIGSDSRRSELMTFATEIANLKSLKTIWDESFGTIHHNLLVNQELYDESLLDSLNSSPTITLHGYNINYNDLTQSEIESVAIGLGLRAFILIDVDKNGKFQGDSLVYKQHDVQAELDYFKVVCTSR